MRYKKWEIGFIVPLIIFIFSAISMVSINPYRYGLSDHSIIIPFIKTYVNGNLYPNDYLLAESQYFYTYLWHAFALLVKYIPIDIPTLFFLAYFLSIYMTFVAVYLIAITLFKNTQVAFLSLFLLLFPFQTLGGVGTLDVLFYTRVASMPVLLFSLYFYLKERYIESFFLQGVGFLVHPLSAAYMIAVLFVASISNLKFIGARRMLLCIGILSILVSPIFVWKLLYSPPSLGLLYADPKWIELLRLRASHHISPGIKSFLRAGIVLVAFLISWKHRPVANYHRIIFYCTMTIVGLCVVGTIFTQIIPLAIVVQFQLLRSFRILVYLAIIYCANYLVAEMKVRNHIFGKVSAGVVCVGIFYATVNFRYQYVGLIALAGFLALYSYWLYERDRGGKYFVMGLVALVVVIGAGGYRRQGPWLANAQESGWLEVQVWAKENTRSHDVFIVPPNRSGFRVESERTIYGDWKDGTQMFFNPDFGFEWFRRMKALGYKKELEIRGFKNVKELETGFKRMSEEDFISVANDVERDGEKTFVVMFEEKDTLRFPIVYRNENYLVYEIVR